jgi:thiamine biosynthesis lipoprotein
MTRPDTAPNNVQTRGAVTRRRALALFGAAAGLPLTAAIAGARPPAGACLYAWHGTALGAVAQITLCHEDRAEAERIVGMCVDEIARLEKVFSLHRPDSELVRLNRDGRLHAPSHDMVKLLTESQKFGALTEGAFDVTVQPLWRVYADHFAANPDDAAGPAPDAVARALDRVDYRAMDIGAGAVVFTRDGMAVTLNGIAQGYITDRVADLLRANGIGSVLLELGETRALDRHPEDRPWRIGLTDPRDPARISRTLELENRAVATSGGYGTQFDSHGRFHHLFDPHSGASAGEMISVSVMTARATVADALSTALYVMAPARHAALVKSVPDITAFITPAAGDTRRLTS